MNEKLALTNAEKAEVYAAEFRANGKSGAEAIIAQAATIAKVENEFGENTKEMFYQGISMNAKGSMARKMKVIGNNRTRLLPHVDQLPPSWTTLYDLARLNTDDFKRVVDAGLVSPSVTAKDIRSVLKGAEKKEARAHRITLDVKSAKHRQALVEKLKKLANEHGIDLTTDPRNKEVIDQYVSKPTVEAPKTMESTT